VKTIFLQTIPVSNDIYTETNNHPKHEGVEELFCYFLLRTPNRKGSIRRTDSLPG